jgi:hypothetical protein
VVFLGSSLLTLIQSNGQKRDKKSKEKNDRNFPQLFWQKVFDMDFPQKVFTGAFELPLLRNAQKCHKKSQKLREKKEEVPTYPL